MRADNRRKGLIERIGWWLVGRAGSLLVRLVYCTVRIRETGLENVERARALGGGEIIYAIFHGRLLGNVYNNRGRGVCVMVSRHRDGEIIARIMERLGFVTVRGSATRGGGSALRAMLRELSAGRDLALTVDGPRGPAGVVKPGVVYASFRSGRPILPTAVGYSRAGVFGSWDSFQVPWPFARMQVVYGPPIEAPVEPKEEDVGPWCDRVGKGIEDAARIADNRAREVEHRGEGGFLRRPVEAFLTRERDRWFHFPLLLALVPLELVWLFLWRVRETLYRNGLLIARESPVPAVCVGSLSVGGSSKTPAAMLVAKLLQEKGFRVAVLTRGYGRARINGRPVVLVGSDQEVFPTRELPRLAGDEATLLARRLPGVLLAVGADRCRSAREAVRNMGAQVLVLDDGFGHRRFGRSMDLLTVNPRLLELTGHVLPAGYLREPVLAAWRARAFLMIRDEGSTAPKPPSRWRLEKPAVHLRRRVMGLTPLSRWPTEGDYVSPAEALRGRRVLAVCGIADPEGFRDMLAGFEPGRLETVGFPDHYPWPESSQRMIARRARDDGATVVTTEKDAVKLDPEILGENCLVLCLDLEDISGGLLSSLLDELVLPAREGWTR